ncbi:MAG: FAD-dependent oxidoreductase [Pseudomonadota bacterium]
MPITKVDLLLIGGGHAHVAVLADWIRRGLPAERAALLTPSPSLRYSGMVPGWIAGEYDRDDGLVDLAALARRAGAELLIDRCIAIEPDERRVQTASGAPIDFGVASINAGGVGRAQAVLGSDPRLLDARPIEGLVEQLDNWLTENESRGGHIAVVGGGAGGVELTFGLRNATRTSDGSQVTLLTGGDGLLPDFAEATRRRVRDELIAQKVALVEGEATLRAGSLVADGQPLLPPDLIIAALGSSAPQWARESRLAVDSEGFILVDQFQRSTSHPHVFAGGDIASRHDLKLVRSGVHAVHTGKVLAANLRAVVAGKTPQRTYRPRQSSLYLISTGNGSAIASYGSVAAQGRWVNQLKRWIDKRWIASYAQISKAT